MRWQSLVPWIAVIVLLLALLGAWVSLVEPAKRKVDDAVTTARSEVARVRGRLPDLVGSRFEEEVLASRREGLEASQRAIESLTKQSQSLSQWFSYLGDIAQSSVPKRDEFKSAYQFTLDRLVEDVTQRYRARMQQDIRDVPFFKPAFIREERIPHDEREMREEQKRFNIERTLVAAAADVGAVPRRPTEVRLDWENSEGLFRRHHAHLFLSVPEGHVPELLRALRTLRGEGPPVGVEEVTVRALPLPKRLDEKATPVVEFEARLFVYELREAKGP